MSSTQSILIWILSFVVFLIIMLISYKFGYKLGIKKALYRTTYILICVIFAFVLAPIVNEYLVDFDLSKINITLVYKEKSFTTIIDYIEEIIAHSKFLNDLYAYFPSLKDLFMDFPQILLVPITYVFLFVVFIVILLPLYLYLSYRRKRRILYDRGDKIHHRIWSGVLGCVQTIFIISVILSPLNGIARIYKNATSDTLSNKESSLCDENKNLQKYEKYCNIIEAYNSTIFSTIGGNDSISDYIFDSLTRISYGDSYTSFSDEASMIVKSGIVLNQSKLLDIVLEGKKSIPVEIVVNNNLNDKDIDIIVETLSDSKYSEELLSELEVVVTNTLNNIMSDLLGVENFNVNYELSEQDRINEIKIVLKAIASFGNTTLLNDMMTVKNKVNYFINEYPENRKTETTVFAFLRDVTNSISIDEFEMFCEHLFESKIFNKLIPHILDKLLRQIGFDFVATDGDVLDQFYNGMDAFRLIKKYQPYGAIELFSELNDEEYVLLAEIIDYMVHSKDSINFIKNILIIIFKDLDVDFHMDEIITVKNWNDEIPFIKKMIPLIKRIDNGEKVSFSELWEILNLENSDLAMIFKDIVSENRALFLQLFFDK